MATKKRDIMREKKDFRLSMDGALKLYNTSLNELTKIACFKNPTSDNLAKIRDALRAVQVGDDTMVIIQSGPFIWKYREQIAKKDDQFFLDNTFKDDIEEAKKKSSDLGKNKDFSDGEIATVMSGLKDTYTKLSGPERETVWRHVMDLLRSYAQYLGAERKLQEIEKEIRALANKK
jgi:hypothetical protein